jgi:hypothetical protein
VLCFGRNVEGGVRGVKAEEQNGTPSSQVQLKTPGGGASAESPQGVPRQPDFGSPGQGVRDHEVGVGKHEEDEYEYEDEDEDEDEEEEEIFEVDPEVEKYRQARASWEETFADVYGPILGIDHEKVFQTEPKKLIALMQVIFNFLSALQNTPCDSEFSVVHWISHWRIELN